MALEAVVFPHELFMKEWYLSMWGGGGGMGACSHDLGDGSTMAEESEKGMFMECDHHGGGGGEALMGNWNMSCSSMMNSLDQEWDANNHSSPENCTKEGLVLIPEQEPAVVAGERRKRRRTKTFKNKEEVENQRMTHIAVERNRRKQMNEYLAVLRSLMPPSYVQRGDQASIIGGAINFVKELEQLLQFLEAEKRIKQRSTSVTVTNPFTNFFTFPQYSMCSSSYTAEVMAENRSAIADIEVTMVESHANLKVLTRRRPRQLLRMVVGLENIRLTTLHLNVTTVDHMVLYSFSVKVEDDCQLNSADEIATAVYQMLEKIQEESESFTCTISCELKGHFAHEAGTHMLDKLKSVAGESSDRYHQTYSSLH